MSNIYGPYDKLDWLNMLMLRENFKFYDKYGLVEGKMKEKAIYFAIMKKSA